MSTFVASAERTIPTERTAKPRPRTCALSVIVPIFNEEENVEPLFTELTEVLDASGLDYEIVFVDDGSTDRTLQRLTALIQENSRAAVVELRRNFGQTAALAAGIENSCGRV